jgi:membrane peptidoglycan carboxypeptidase
VNQNNSQNKLANGRQAGAKTGTWEYGKTADNAQAWYVGFTPALATAVNITSRDPKVPAIRYYNSGKNPQNCPTAATSCTTIMNGTNTPGLVWTTFMNAALKGSPVQPLPTAKHVGDPTVGNAPSPVPSAPPTDPNQGGQGGGNGGGGNGGGNPCFIPAFCQTQSPTPKPSKSSGH